MAFYCLLTDFVDISPGSLERLILDGDGIITESIFVQVPNQYFMDMWHDVVTTDDAGYGNYLEPASLVCQVQWSDLAEMLSHLSHE